MRTLGLDIGSNSVGSAWVDTEKHDVTVGVSVFPAGVEETEEGRGAPRNQDRRGKRSLRRSLARRSARKRALRKILTQHRLIPSDPKDLKSLFAIDPWQLRRRGLDESLSPHEFGRVLLHLCQRRGAQGLNIAERKEEADNPDDVKKNKKLAAIGEQSDPDAKVKGAVDHTKRQMQERDARTFGELMAILSDERRNPVFDTNRQIKLDHGGQPVVYADAIRNRLDSFEFHADREIIRQEFEMLWQKQKSCKSELSRLLTEDVRTALDYPTGNDKWRHQGALFGQRRTYWNTGTLGRCDLEPTDRCVPIADRHASYYRVLETVNNLRICGPGEKSFRTLTPKEHGAVVAKLRSQKTGSIAAIRMALGIDIRSLKKQDISEDAYKLNVAGDDRDLNGDWFHKAIVLDAITAEVWENWDESRKEGLNRAILRFDPQIEDDAARLQTVAKRLGLDESSSERLNAAWRTRPKLERRLKMSRRAVLNLLPYMEKPRPDGHWPTQIEARRTFAADLETSDQKDQPETSHRIRRYRVGGSRLNKADRHYMDKHGILPPAPTLSNPVVRKAIHEVRRHVIAHIRAHDGEFPDRIVIEFARETTKPKKLNDRILYRAFNRNKIRKRIIEEVVMPAFGEQSFHLLSHNQLRAAVERVVLCEQQREVCAYSVSGKAIAPQMAALGHDLEVDHIIPYSRCGDNSLNNRVLCFRDANRNKGRQTPREWWGDTFDERCAPMRFMESYSPAKSDYFERREYMAKWRNLSRTDVADEWKGSQLSDTAYAAREVQTYLQQALWPDEPSHLEGGKRRILVTKGIYTSILRKDWQLYQKLVRGHEASPEDIQHASLKNRGDHREHAIDAVAIALTDSERIQELARRARVEEEEKVKAIAQGREPKRVAMNPILPPWGDVKSFRQQVLSQLFDAFDPADAKDHHRPVIQRVVVAHRPVGKKLTGKFHQDNPFGPIEGIATRFTRRIPISKLKPKHLRMPCKEKPKDAIDRLGKRYLITNKESNLKNARKRAKQLVESNAYIPKMAEPLPEKTGLVRDRQLRKILRDQITERLSGTGRDADTFTEADLKKMLKDGPFRMPSSIASAGVPIKRVILLWTVTDPVLIPLRKFDPEKSVWQRVDPQNEPESLRAYQGDDNHHIEIRENKAGVWSGTVVRTFDAAKRVRIGNAEAVDRSDDQEKGRFVMSLSEGETLWMRHKETNNTGYFVVVKLDKPQTIQFKQHWDARRAKGEKNDQGEIIPESVRELIPVSASQLKSLAPSGENAPIKVSVDSLGRVWRLEPVPVRTDDESEIDSRVLAIAREAISLRATRSDAKSGKSSRDLPGSWKWMRSRLSAEGCDHLGSQLSAAFRVLRKAIR